MGDFFADCSLTVSGGQPDNPGLPHAADNLVKFSALSSVSSPGGVLDLLLGKPSSALLLSTINSSLPLNIYGSTVGMKEGLENS